MDKGEIRSVSLSLPHDSMDSTNLPPTPLQCVDIGICLSSKNHLSSTGTELSAPCPCCGSCRQYISFHRTLWPAGRPSETLERVCVSITLWNGYLCFIPLFRCGCFCCCSSRIKKGQKYSYRPPPPPLPLSMFNIRP